eukprot:4896866-Prymnesium_polylepis.2
MKLRTDKVKAAKVKAEEEGRSISAQERLTAEKLTDGYKEGIFPKFNCALYWRLKAEESKAQVVDRIRPTVEPNEEWLRKFDAPHSHAAHHINYEYDPKQLDEESLEAEAELRAQARLGGAEGPGRLPPVSAGNLFKLKGSATGEQAVHIVRAREGVGAACGGEAERVSQGGARHEERHQAGRPVRSCE